MRARWLLSAMVLVACSSAAPIGPGVDSGAGGDAEVSDSGSSADVAVSDGSSADAGNINEILGTFGPGTTCPLVSPDLPLSTPSLREDALIFSAGEKYERASLSAGGQTIYDTPNAGGSSIESEIVSFEILHYCEGATLLHTETEIAYAPPDDSGPNTITDYEVVIGGKKVGVSVTRAYKPKPLVLTDADVQALLEKKLDGVIRSSQRVLPIDKWVKQVLHVFVQDKDGHDAVVRVWNNAISAATKADTIVLLTQTTGGGFIYCNPDPPLGMECP